MRANDIDKVIDYALSPSGTKINEITQAIIGAAIEVHRALGPGLLESAYEECLCRELSIREIPFQR